MNAISEAIQKLHDATKIIEHHINEPQNYNSTYTNDFEVIAWEIYRQTNDLKHIANRYGVA